MISASTFAQSFFDGFGPSGLFLRLSQPGAPSEVFEPESEKEGKEEHLFEYLKEQLHQVAPGGHLPADGFGLKGISSDVLQLWMRGDSWQRIAAQLGMTDQNLTLEIVSLIGKIRQQPRRNSTGVAAEFAHHNSKS